MDVVIMPYHYQDHRAWLFTEDGQVTFLKVRDKTKELLALAGACQSGKMTAGLTGDSWCHLACVDRLVELGEICEVTKPGEVWGQHRVFVGGGR
jgi:hypothetical protein